MRKAFVSSLAKRRSKRCRPFRATTARVNDVVRSVSSLYSSPVSSIASSFSSSSQRTRSDQNVSGVRPLSTRFVENLITFPSSARTKKRTIRTTSRGFASASADTVKSGDDDDDFGDDDEGEEERKLSLIHI